MIKAIIVDDENSAIKSLSWEIENFCQNIEVIETFTSPVDAIAAINYLKPDCVFLDIEMPEMDGFQLLDELQYRSFDLIITTAYDSYALKAFKESAIDYLLKPIDSDDLIKSVAKIQANKEKNTLGKELYAALERLQPKPMFDKIGLPYAGKTIFVDSDNIMYCKSDGNYTELFLKAGKKVLSKKLKDVEALLNAEKFIRVHNSYIVNFSYIKEFIKNEGLYLILDDGSNIPVSRTRKAELMKLLNL